SPVRPMSLQFYGLREKPFNTTPDPRFLYLTPALREALAQLVYGVEERKGFVVLTGEIGTGKTTLLHALRRRLPESTSVAFVVNSRVTLEGILTYSLAEFGVTGTPGSKAHQLLALRDLLMAQEQTRRNSVLILDEAQNLDAQTLEEVRLLSNYETGAEKALQILLVGQ